MTIKTWYVEVRLFGHLAEELVSDHGYDLIERDPPSLGKLLCHPKYAAFQSAAEPRLDARDLGAKLARFSAAQDIELGFEVGDVQQVNDDGTTSRHLVRVCSSHIQIHSGAVTKYTPDPSLSEAERKLRGDEAAARAEEHRKKIDQERDALLRKRARAALNNPAVLDVMELMKIANPTLTELGHIVDIVKDAYKGTKKDFSRDSEFKRFRHSINDRQTFGLDARHAVQKETPPDDPMSKSEALAYAHGVGAGWLRTFE